MATASSSGQQMLAVDSYDTALCIIPPKQLWPSIEKLRALYDKAYDKWPPHLNLIYPFVSPQNVPVAAERIASALDERNAAGKSSNVHISLTATACFSHRNAVTVYRHDSRPGRVAALTELRTDILRLLGQRQAGGFNMHMSVAQTDSSDSDLKKFITNKISLLPPTTWTATSLVILVRQKDQAGWNSMRFWGAIDLNTRRLLREPDALGFCLDRKPATREDSGDIDVGSHQTTYTCSSAQWEPLDYGAAQKITSVAPEHIIVAAYNVLAEFSYPISQARYPLLVQNLLSTTALADILVLEEVTDDFLHFLLSEKDLQERYCFATHGPPGQGNVDPLPSMLNQVVLSRYAFQWDLLQLKRQHKTSAVLSLPIINRTREEGPGTLVVATCHLTHGLTDGAVAAKMGELHRILNYLERRYKGCPWVLAGDFNITTSSYTIREAVRSKAILSQTAQHLASLENMLSEAGFLDAWVVARCEVGESSDELRRGHGAWETFEGEQGATFDPRQNELASRAVGSGFNNRPQRYDRILVKPEGAFHVGGFNMFGFSTLKKPDDGSTLSCASDHWGIRCLLKTGMRSVPAMPGSSVADEVPLVIARAPANLADGAQLRRCLSESAVFPTQEEATIRDQSFTLLKDTIQSTSITVSEAVDSTGRLHAPLIVVPVGSYGLGVWTRDSDIDCMCIGQFSPRTFFALVIPKLRTMPGIKIIRRVKANTGTMLELEIMSIKIDLQYCRATTITEGWPSVMKRPASDSCFALPTQTLLKLKPARDLFYLLRSIPDLAQFRLAYMLIKIWAKERGLFSAKFGYLGGIHISVMLVRVCKILAHNGVIASVTDVVMTFFDHYANFDFGKRMVFDPFFHREFRYTRTFREPLCLLGWHAPVLNTALRASVPTMKIVADELKTASRLLCQPGMTWSGFLGFPRHENRCEAGIAPGASGFQTFLAVYKTYIKIDVQYWGPSRQRGNQFVGWLESRCVLLLVELHKKIPSLIPRIWPTKFVAASEASAITEEGDEYHGCFLIGLELDDNENLRQTKGDIRIFEGTLHGVITQFEERMRGDEKYYDPKTCWLAATVCWSEKLGRLTPDKTGWGTKAGGDWDTDSDWEDDEEMNDEDDGAGPQKLLPGISASNRGGVRAQSGLPAKAPGKFRTAADVMNRLRWDEKMDSSDYLVGYEDRFVGAREKALESWKSEQTDEEFIPQHRILYFKRKSDSVIIWQRSTRTDILFGSGI